MEAGVLELGSSLNNDVQVVGRRVDPQLLIWLKHSLHEFESDYILEIPRKMSQEEQTFLDRPYVGFSEDT